MMGRLGVMYGEVFQCRLISLLKLACRNCVLSMRVYGLLKPPRIGLGGSSRGNFK